MAVQILNKQLTKTINFISIIIYIIIKKKQLLNNDSRDIY
jgi:hypothetical protein